MTERILTVDDDTPAQPLRCVTDQEIYDECESLYEELKGVLNSGVGLETAENPALNWDYTLMFGKFGLNYKALLQYCRKSIRGFEFETEDGVFDGYSLYCKLYSLAKSLQQVFVELHDLENRISNIEILVDSVIAGEHSKAIWVLNKLEKRKLEVKNELDEDRKRLLFKFFPFLIDDYKRKSDTLNLILRESAGLLEKFDFYLNNGRMGYGVGFHFLDLKTFWRSREPVIEVSVQRLLLNIDKVLEGLKNERLRMINFGARMLQGYETNLSKFSELSERMSVPFPPRLSDPIQLSQTLKRRFGGVT